MHSFLSKELSDAGFSSSNIIDNVTIIEDFLSQEELDHVFSIINKTPDSDWRIEYMRNLKRFCLEKFGRGDVENLVAEGKFEITQNWDDKNLNIRYDKIYEIMHKRIDDLIKKADSTLELSGFATIQRMQPGVELKSHTDQHTDPSIRYATILYLNDDYVDGELFFKNKDVYLRPKPGSLLIFPGNEEFEHGVKHVGDGPIRYVIVGFIKVKNFYDNNKY
jgi:hypothetical protein